MLTKANAGKYFTKEYHDLFQLGCKDRTQLSDEEIAWTELPANEGLGDHDDERWLIETQPTGSRQGETRMIDARAFPECGDDKED